MDLRTSPSCEIRRNSLDVVAVWKYDFFSFTKNVSGTQRVFLQKYLVFAKILFTKIYKRFSIYKNSVPTESVLTPGGPLNFNLGSFHV